MLFNSYEFIFAFLPLTFFIYFYLNSKRLTVAAKGFLVFASLFFYSWWNIVYLPLILGSILFNFMIGSALSRSRSSKFSKKSVLVFGIIANVALLGYFKYSDFFITNSIFPQAYMQSFCICFCLQVSPFLPLLKQPFQLILTKVKYKSMIF